MAALGSSGANLAEELGSKAGASGAATGAATAGVEAAAEAGLTLSGAEWCAQYPTGTTIAELTNESFRTAVQEFHDAMVEAATADNNLSIDIEASYRPAERAHLMHYCLKVANGTISPATANERSAAAGIPINWDHGNLATSKSKARAMANTYQIVYPASLTSLHISGQAIDWYITWSGSLNLARKGETETLDCTGSGTSSGYLQSIGRSYGVIKLAGDPPHWSATGG